MKRTLVINLLFAGLVSLVAGCASAPKPPPDVVAIVDVQSTEIPNSEYTRFTVRVGYLLHSSPNAVVTLGFDLEQPGRYIILTQQEVNQESGEVEMSADVRLPKRDVVTLYADLSKAHHPSEWRSLASVSRVLTIKK